jgi:hypothetical protein
MMSLRNVSGMNSCAHVIGMMAPMAKSADHIRVAHGFVRKYVRFTGHHFRVVKRIMTKMEHVAELMSSNVEESVQGNHNFDIVLAA